MQRISSTKYPLTRQVMPMLRRPMVLTLMALVVVGLIASGLWILLLMPALPLLLLLVIHYAPNLVLPNFCEDAWLDESGVQLQFRKQRLQIPFEQIREISWHGSNNPPRAKIWLRTANEHGRVFTFVPDLGQGKREAKRQIEALNNQL